MLKFLNGRFEELLGAFLLALMASISFINVIVRYCTNLSFSSSEELTVNFFVWIVLLGTARTFRNGSNFSMNVIYNISPLPARKFMYIFGVVCSVAFFATLVYLGTIEVLDEYELDVSSEALDIPAWLYTIATPLFSLLIIVRIIQKVIADYKAKVIGGKNA
ncbi:MAG: TRAP transporter small permease [Burkholderiales bacterium]|nr:TRAP transporter small permease [Burkholderiales bacterium]